MFPPNKQNPTPRHIISKLKKKILNRAIGKKNLRTDDPDQEKKRSDTNYYIKNERKDIITDPIDI